MSDNEFLTSIEILRLLTEALTKPRSFEEAIGHIIQMTCVLMETEQAVFLLRDEDRGELLVRSAVGLEQSNIRVGNFLDVPERLKRILWDMKNIHHINWVDSGIVGLGFPIIVSPIFVKGARVGLLVTGQHKTKTQTPRPFDVIQQKLFELIGPFASLVLENAKVYDLLQQHFALNSPELKQLASSPESNVNVAEQLTLNTLNNPTKVIKILSESFYKQLKRAGFQRTHIITAISQMMDCILNDN